MANRLQHETSPYLLQHRDNPVDWYPWGEEALSAARAGDKPIFLSVGYSACHWCHVMERESFEDAAIAEVMNDLFVNIKVDREERPDIDSVYMSAVQAMTGHGGWPMSVFLTPAGEPFYGGTYFPPDERGNMPSFPRVLRSVHDAYRNRRGDITANSGRVLDAIRAQTQPRRSAEPITAGLLWNAGRQLAVDFDDVNGGTGTQPKFPQPMLYEFLLTHAQVANNIDARAHTGLTLTKMQDGGIHDQIGGGFHRYSVDSQWLVPHFEKMLYDNAQMASLYLHAWQSTKHGRFADAVTRTLDYLLREMRHAPTGGFYSATDADSEGEEGLFFTWTHGEFMSALPDETAELAGRYWGVTRDGNFEGRNILHVGMSAEEVGAEIGVDAEEVARQVEAARVALYRARLGRVAPLTDDKVIASWNALAVGALAGAGALLGRADWQEAARVTADFVLTRMVREGDGRLMRAYKPGAVGDDGAGQLSPIAGFLEDYAYLADALLTLYESDFDLRWLASARWLCDESVRLFWDAQASAFYDAGIDQDALVVRPRDVYDNAQPSGGSAMTYALLRCAQFTGDVEHARIAAQSLRGAMWLMQRAPAAVTWWLKAAAFYAYPVRQVVLVGDPGSAEMQALLEIYREEFRPDAIVAVLDPEDAGHLASRLPLFEGRVMVDGKATAYVCRDYVCDLPVTDPEALREQLSAR